MLEEMKEFLSCCSLQVTVAKLWDAAAGKLREEVGEKEEVVG